MKTLKLVLMLLLLGREGGNHYCSSGHAFFLNCAGSNKLSGMPVCERGKSTPFSRSLEMVEDLGLHPFLVVRRVVALSRVQNEGREITQSIDVSEEVRDVVRDAPHVRILLFQCPLVFLAQN